MNNFVSNVMGIVKLKIYLTISKYLLRFLTVAIKNKERGTTRKPKEKL